VKVHLNGHILPLDEARISPLDRGFLFGDGLYEGLRAFGGKLVGMALHEKRLQAGLDEARIPWDATRLTGLSHELLEANRLRDAFVYWQISRGVPAPGQPVRARVLSGPVTPTVFGYVVPTPPLSSYPPVPAKRASRVRDTRWLRGHVKSIALMGSCLAAMDAAHEGNDDALMIRDATLDHPPLLAEATSANAMVVLERSGGGGPGVGGGGGVIEIATPDLVSTSILAGVTRDLMIEAAARGLGGWKHGPISERPVTAAELDKAREVVICGTLSMVTAITHLDGRPVGTGEAGPVAHDLLKLLIAAIGAG
jgi:D-alanine transaminase